MYSHLLFHVAKVLQKNVIASKISMILRLIAKKLLILHPLNQHFIIFYMAINQIIHLRKGLDIRLKGRAEEQKLQLKSNGKYALVPDDFEGVTPKVVVREGDHVKG